MAPVVQSVHPESVRAGNTWAWKISFADYPVSEGWALSYALFATSSGCQNPLTWDDDWVTDDGSEWTVTIPATETEKFVAGSYQLTAYVTLSGQRYSPYNAPLKVEANTASLAVGEGVTHAEKALADVEALIAGRLQTDVASYSIAQRAVNREELERLYQLRARYRREVWQQRNPGQPLPGQRLVTFIPCA